MHTGAFWPPCPVSRADSTDTICVPLKVDRFRLRQSVQSGTLTMATTMAVGFCAFPAVGLYGMAVDPGANNHWIGVMLFSLILPLLTGILALSEWQTTWSSKSVLNQNLPALIVNCEGVWDYSSRYVYGFIPWKDIDKVMLDNRYIGEVGKNFPGIGFVVTHPDVLLRRKPWIIQIAMRKDPFVTDRREVFIMQEFLDADTNELVKKINDFRARMTQ